MWRLLRPIDIYVVEPHNEFTGNTALIVPYYGGVYVPVKHEVNNTIERDKSDGDFMVKVSCIIFVNCLCKLQSHNFFQFIICYCLFYANDKATYQPCAYSSTNPKFIRNNN